MRRALACFAAFAFVASLSGAALAADPPATLPAKKESCHGPDGKFIKCPPPAATTTVAKKCRDKTTKKFAKCDAANTEPVPVKAPAKAPAKAPT